jgi:hypothetical protein
MAQTSETPPGMAGLGDAVCLEANSPQDNRIDRSPQAQSSARQRLRRQRLVEHLHRLGPAPLGHFLSEVENGASIHDHLERYARIDPDFVRALGGDRFPPALHVVDGGDRS